MFDLTSDIFKTIAPTTDLFIWLGDVAYVDTPNLKMSAMPKEYVEKRFAMT